MNKWMMILLSGFLAAMINVSQFFIIGTAGAVESTVVGQLKTCLIVLIGAFTGGRIITDKAALGIMLALCSIFASVLPISPLPFRAFADTRIATHTS